MKVKKIINLILKAISLAMGISVVVLTILNELHIKDAIIMLAIGISCISIILLENNK